MSVNPETLRAFPRDPLPGDAVVSGASQSALGLAISDVARADVDLTAVLRMDGEVLWPQERLRLVDQLPVLARILRTVQAL